MIAGLRKLRYLTRFKSSYFAIACWLVVTVVNMALLAVLVVENTLKSTQISKYILGL